MRRLVALLVLAPLGLSGCSDNGLTLGRVHGTVTYKGKPLPAGEILFMPDEASGTVGPPASGTIGADGSYSMSTEESGDGAIVGSHRVGITGRESKPMNPDAVITESSSAADVLKAKARMGQPQPRKGSGPTVRDRSGAVYRLLTPESLQSPATSNILVKVEQGSNVKNISIKEDGTATVE